jgi:hypothetical protein
MQTNNTSNSYNSSNTHLKIATANYMTHKPSSVPSSPTLPVRARSIKKSISGTVIGKTDKTVTYVRETGSKNTNKTVNKLYNGFDSSSSNGSSHSSSSANRLAPEASPEISDVDSDHSHELLTFNRIDIDLMGELKDFLNKRSSIDESSNSNKSNISSNSQSSSTSNSLNHFIAKPIPPPRTQLTRKLKPINDSNCKEVPLIELDTPPEEEDKNDIIFDPLFEKKTDSKRRPISVTSSNNWGLNNNNLNTLTSLTPNSSNNSLSSPINAVNPFAIENHQKNEQKNNLFISSGQTSNAQTSALSLSVTNTNQTTSNSFNDMINWSSSQITSGSQNVNQLLGRPLPISTPTQTNSNSNPFKTTGWQHFD